MRFVHVQPWHTRQTVLHAGGAGLLSWRPRGRVRAPVLCPWPRLCCAFNTWWTLSSLVLSSLLFSFLATDVDLTS